jgi:hypothetical protein
MEMKLWTLIGLFSVLSIPAAFASETTSECRLDARQPARVEATMAPADVREAVKAARVTQSQAQNAIVVPRPLARAETARRRNGSPRRVPDALLIDGRGIL